MSFADKKTRNQHLHHLQQMRRSRIRALIERGLIESGDEIPEHAIPIDFNQSTKASLIMPQLYYEDIEYSCCDCGKSEIWRAETQQHYFEVIKAKPHAQAVRCRLCQGKHKRSKES